ncbi:MAG: hypothetical protein ABI893_10630 [Polaromonas sp.]
MNAQEAPIRPLLTKLEFRLVSISDHDMPVIAWAMGRKITCNFLDVCRLRPAGGGVSLRKVRSGFHSVSWEEGARGYGAVAPGT